MCCSWSGGKDSCLAFQKAVDAGAAPQAILTVFTEDGMRTRSHGLHRSVIEAQAAALGVSLWSVSTSWKDYEGNLIEALRKARKRGIEAVVFGDMDIESHREWELRVAGEAGLLGLLPLWGRSRRAVLAEWWRSGSEARIVVAREGVVPRALLGRTLDAGLAAELERRGVDACGENGEFHTLAVNAPLFRRALALSYGRQVKRADCWFQDVSVQRASCLGDPVR